MRDSIVFYRSFYEAINELEDPEDFKKAVQVIMEYGLNGIEPDAKGIVKAVFKLVKPQIDANNQRYVNGTKGGRPRKKTEEEIKESTKARNSQDYLKWRNEVYKRDNYTCCICGSTEDLHAHHKKDFDYYPELRFELSNGITLCRECHTKVHNSQNQDVNSQNQKKPSVNQESVSEKPNVNVNVNENVNENENILKPFAQGQSPCAGKFLLNDGTEYIITENDVETYQQLYPGIDVRQEIRNIQAWCLSNPKNRKTRNGAKRFLNSWLSRAQNRARPEEKQKSKNRFNNFEQRQYDYAQLEKQLLGG